MCELGRELEPGTPIGLIEVMKTFAQVVYRAERGLPARARIVRVLARDGADVDEGAPLIAVAPR
jgi:biotin carboxyl carrier protein